MENKPTVKIKTMTYYIKNNITKQILDWMTKISKNIYNTTLFIYKVYKIYQNDIYKNVYDYIIEKNLHINFINSPKKNKKDKKHIKYDKTAKKEEKHPDLVKIETFFYGVFDIYYKSYIKNKLIVDSNNKIIFKYIINDINKNNIVISNINYKQLIDKYLDNVIKLDNVNYNKSNKSITIDNIVKSIIKSLYCKNYFYVQKQMKNSIKIDNKFIDVINAIKNNNYIYEDDDENYRNKIINELNIEKLSSIENFISRITYKYIGDNKEKIPSDVIINIISKAYSNIKSYYNLLKSGKQANTKMCKYLGKDDKFNLFYYCRSYLKLEDGIRLNVGAYINNNFNTITNNNYKYIIVGNTKKYYNENNLINLDKKTLAKKKKKGIKYQKIVDKYINKEHLISYNYVYISLPKKIEFETIKLIEIKPEHGNIKICINYEKIYENEIKEYDMKAYEKLSVEKKLKLTTSIDTGVYNLLTIYNPTGEQHIIKGGILLSINHFYNKKIDRLNSINKKENDKSDYKRLHSLLKERENKINGFMDKVVEILVTKYKEKEVFIIGYNPNWKNKTNMGKKNNRNFYMIPYKKLIEKLEEKLKCINKKLLIVNESYTSKCDALALESLCAHEKYLGKREERGLFKSSTKEIINADLNGAINIMRKRIEMKEIKGEKLKNPSVIKL